MTNDPTCPLERKLCKAQESCLPILDAIAELVKHGFVEDAAIACEGMANLMSGLRRQYHADPMTARFHRFPQGLSE